MTFWVQLLLIGIALTATGCSYFIPDPPCPPPPSAKEPITPTFSCLSATVPLIYPEPTVKLALADLIDIGLQNSPQTRASWYRAKQAAADLGTARGAFLPPIIASGNYLGEPVLAEANDQIGRFVQNYSSVNLSTSYLLFDFGGRSAAVQQAQAALYSLNWTFNWQVQTVMLRIITQYYVYLNAVGIVLADKDTVHNNLKTVEATTALRSAGVKSLGDELQARTTYLQSQLVLENDIGSMNVAKAGLAAALGLPADTELLVEDIPEELPTQHICGDMERLIKVAKDNRADLMARRSDVLNNRAKIRSAISNALPSFNTMSSVGEEWINGTGPEKIWALGFNLNFNLFNSFADVNAIKKAEALWLESQANLDDAERLAFLSVLTDYYTFLASTNVLNFSNEYLQVAIKNQEAAFANYKYGITTIADIVIANNALGVARRQVINAKISWLTSLADLAYDTGGLSIEDVKANIEIRPRLIETCDDNCYEEPFDE